MIDQSVGMARGGWRARLPQRMPAPLLVTVHGIAVWLALDIGNGAGLAAAWNPAAGFRLAVLWYAGARLTPALALVEFVVHWALGSLSFGSPGWTGALWGIVGPVLAYGATVAAIRGYAKGAASGAMTSPMPFGLAAVAAPCIAALAILPRILWGGEAPIAASGRDAITSLTAFAVGDLLGALIVAPPLLWTADVLLHPKRAPRAILADYDVSWKSVLEAALVLAVAVFASAVFVRVEVGSQPAPIILAVVWIGLRFGVFAVWIALAVVIVLMLSSAVTQFGTVDRLQHHFDFATVAVAGYLAGSYRDAQKRARADMERRDRLLFQAERLKTLRSMSVAVIHEISQPLSTLAIEAKHLHESTAGSGREIAQSAALIHRKAATLSNLVRRLRRFGGGAVDQPSPLPVRALIESVAAIVQPEAKSEGVILKIRPIHPDLVVLGQEVELSQAVVNLLRNALHGTSDKTVDIAGQRDGEEVRITVSNRCAADRPASTGMGVGTLVAQAIVEAHGGRLVRAEPAEGLAVAAIVLPLVGGAHEWG